MPRQIQTLLCVDDEENGLFLRKKVLEKAGYTVLTASSGDEALKIFDLHSIDAVILDFFMPGMNGLKVAAKLKASGAQIPIIILSAYSPLMDEALGLADLWLTKASADGSQLPRVLSELSTIQ